MLVGKGQLTFKQALRSIRELVLDVGLVKAFHVYGQDLFLSKEGAVFTIGTEEKTIDEDFRKVYDLVRALVVKKAKIGIYPDYVPTEYLEGLVDYNFTAGEEPDEEKNVVYAEHYFSDEFIQRMFIDFFYKYLSYDGVERTVEEIYDTMDDLHRLMSIYWVSYWLIDRKRMQMASTSMLINKENGLVGCDGGEFKTKNVEVTTRIGDVYTERETTDDKGAGLDGITALWGDKYGYYTKLQLYIRSLWERLTGDYSLRDNVMITQSFTIAKKWELDSWVNTHAWSYDTYNLLVENRDRD